eukprot:589950-Rhodomonas_salina.1
MIGGALRRLGRECRPWRLGIGRSSPNSCGRSSRWTITITRSCEMSAEAAAPRSSRAGRCKAEGGVQPTLVLLLLVVQD